MNIWLTQWKKTGKNISVPQFSLTVKVGYISADGKSKTGQRTVLFPDCLANMPPDYLQEKITDLLIDKAAEEIGAKVLSTEAVK